MKINFKNLQSKKIIDKIKYKVGVAKKSRDLSEEEEEKLEKNLVWITSPPRSGTTWLGTQLLSYQTRSMNEPQLGLHLGMRQPRIREKIVRQIDLYSKEPDYFFSNRYSKTWSFYLRKLILHRIFAQFEDLSHKIIIKEPSGTMGIDIITNCLPKSRIIFLVRDGRDTIDSKIASFQKDGWATKDYGYSLILPEKKISEVKYQAELWVRLMEILSETFNAHSPKLRYLVKYENLRENTSEELMKIYDFLQIEIPEKELRKIVEQYSFENIPSKDKGTTKVTRSASPGKWKESFSEEEQSLMQEIMGKTLEEFGY